MSEVGGTAAATRHRLRDRVVGRLPWLPVGLAVLLTVALRLPLIGVPIYPDEGGYLLVAHYWGSGGRYLYGGLFVDRPPLLLAVFRLADALGGIDALRLIGLAVVVAMVVSAGWAGWLVGGCRAASWAAFVAAALGSSPLLGAAEVDGELLAAPLVVISCTLMLAATRPSRGARFAPALYALAAGVLAASAVLVKQNFLDALVFAVTLLAASVVTGPRPVRAAARLLGAFVAGAALPAAAAVVWAVGWATGVGDLWFVMYGFRWRVLGVLHGQDLIPADRLRGLEVSAVASGMLALAIVFGVFVVLVYRERGRLDPLVIAAATTLAFEVVGVALGGNYYRHYLLQLAPSLVLATACLASGTLAVSAGGRALLWARLGLGFVIVSAVVVTADAATLTPQPSTRAVAFETWIQAAARPTDSLMMTFGIANLVEPTGLRPAYQHLWTLPTRVMDPELLQLSATLAGRQAPTWVVEWQPFELLGSGPAQTLRTALSAHYRRVADICGHQVFQLDDTRRSLPATVGPCDS